MHRVWPFSILWVIVCLWVALQSTVYTLLKVNAFLGKTIHRLLSIAEWKMHRDANILLIPPEERADRNIFSGHITIRPLVVISWVNIPGISFFDVEKLVAEKLSRFMTNTFKIVFFFLFIQRGCLDSPVFWWGPPTTRPPIIVGLCQLSSGENQQDSLSSSLYCCRENRFSGERKPFPVSKCYFLRGKYREMWK